VELNPPKDLKPRHLVGVFYCILFCGHFFVYLHYMRKITFLFAVAVTLTIAACGSGSTANQKTDSTVVVADTTAAVVDSVAKTPTTGGEVKPEQPQK